MEYDDKPDLVKKSSNGDPIVRGVLNVQVDQSEIYIKSLSETYNITSSKGVNYTFNQPIEPDFYQFVYKNNVLNLSSSDNNTEEKVKIGFGGFYTLVGSIDENEVHVKLHELIAPNTVNIFWLVPQYFFITVAEIMFSITGLEFAFTQAPVSMKSLLQASWQLTVSVGNLIVIVIAKSNLFDDQVII